MEHVRIERGGGRHRRSSPSTGPSGATRLSTWTLDELHGVIDEIEADPAVRVVILTGAGVGFCAGADMKATPEDMNGLDTPLGTLLERTQGQVARRTFMSQELMASLFEKIHRLRQPVIAAVNGAATVAASRSRWPATSASRPSPPRSARSSSSGACRPATWAPATTCPGWSARLARPSCC